MCVYKLLYVACCSSAICCHIIEAMSADSYIVVYVGYFSCFLYLIYDSDGKKPRCGAAFVLANLMDYSIATSDSEIIFLLIGKAIHEHGV